MSRYTVSCQSCGKGLGKTNDPKIAEHVAASAANHDAQVIAKGLVNKIRYNRATREVT